MKEVARIAKARLLKLHYDAGVGHIGGNLSCIDILLTLHHRLLGSDDRFVLSKGHAAGAMYITLWTLGRIAEEELLTFHKENTLLSGHPAVRGVGGIEFATGSLGHGLSLACGLALAKRYTLDQGRAYCLMSDGEWQEGSNWEAVIFAQHQNLPVTVIVDANGLQGFGSTSDVAGMDNLASRFRGFGCSVIEVDGHDHTAFERACRQISDGFAIIVAHTNKGNGVSFMSGKMEWHYLPMTQALYEQALKELEAAA